MLTGDDTMQLPLQMTYTVSIRKYKQLQWSLYMSTQPCIEVCKPSMQDSTALNKNHVLYASMHHITHATQSD